MTTLNSKFDVESVREIHQQLSDIQMIATSSRIDDWELASALDNVTRTAAMFCDVIEQHLKGKIETNNPLGYIKDKTSSAHTMAMQIKNRRS